MRRERDREALAERYYAVQVPILEEAQSCFISGDLQDLRCIVRLAVEFDDYLKREDLTALDSFELDYLAGSVFAGVNSFASVAHGYGVLVGATQTVIDWPAITSLRSPLEFKGKYLEVYRHFETLDVKTQFEEKVRVVLDLFKLQLIFVGILYRWQV